MKLATRLGNCVPTKIVGVFTVGTLLLLPTMATADTYRSASFSGALGSSANVKPPFSTNGFNPGDSFSGSFVFDNQLVPPNPSSPTFVNVPFSSFPDIALIPDATAFNINFDGLKFNLGDNLSSLLLTPGIQYKNGVFNGFVFVTQFLFHGSEYQFRIDGPNITVQLLGENGFPVVPLSNLISAKIDVQTGLTNEAPFVPGVPLPSALSLFATGLGALGLLGWRRKRKAQA